MSCSEIKLSQIVKVFLAAPRKVTSVQNDEVQMSSDAYDYSRQCAGKMREGRHDFMARVGDEIIVIKDVPAFICNTCGEIEYALEVSREIDRIRKEFFAGRLLAKPLAAGEIVFKPKRADSID
jgi:YgiT-type zinc finger domain-containing protein